MRVLLLHRLNLGDLVCASPALQWLRARFPEARFRLLTNDFAARVGQLLPEVEEVLPYRKFGEAAPREWRQWLRARAWHPHRVLPLAFSDDRKLVLRARWLGPYAKPDFDGAPAHVAERIAWVAGWRGEQALPGACLQLPSASTTARDIALWVSARKPSNRMHAKQVLDLVRELRLRRTSARIGVFGRPAETDSAAHVADAAMQAELARGLAHLGCRLETPPFNRLIAELAASASVIAPDGGMAHIAAGLGKPVVALFGEVDPAKWRPWSPLAVPLHAASGRVGDLPVREIADAWEDAISRSG